MTDLHLNDDDDDNGRYHLYPNDKEPDACKFAKVTKKEISISKLLTSFDEGSRNEKDEHGFTKFEFTKLNGVCMFEIVEFLKIRDGDGKTIEKKPIKSGSMSRVCGKDYQADAKYIDRFYKVYGIAGMYKLIWAADSLGIEPLIHLAIAKIASLIRDVHTPNLGGVLEVKDEREVKTFPRVGLSSSSSDASHSRLPVREEYRQHNPSDVASTSREVPTKPSKWPQDNAGTYGFPISISSDDDEE